MRAFREAVEAWDIDWVLSLMTEDVEFRSPVVHKAYRGREELADRLGLPAA